MKIKFLLLTIIFTFIGTGLLPAQDLINAVKSGSIEQVEKLLPYENMDETDENNFTAYHWTAISGNKEIAELLLENGAEPNALATDVPFKNAGGGVLIWGGDIMGAKSAAVLAEENGHSDLVDFFLSKGNIDYGLRAAVMCNNPIVEEKALKLGADPDMYVNLGGRRIIVTAAEVALATGSDECMDILLENGADISTAFASSLIYDRFSTYHEVWEKLLKKGAEVNPIFKDPNHPQDTLFNIVKHKHDEYKYDGRYYNKFKFLVDHGANPNK